MEPMQIFQELVDSHQLPIRIDKISELTSKRTGRYKFYRVWLTFFTDPEDPKAFQELKTQGCCAPTGNSIDILNKVYSNGQVEELPLFALPQLPEGWGTNPTPTEPISSDTSDDATPTQETPEPPPEMADGKIKQSSRKKLASAVT